MRPSIFYLLLVVGILTVFYFSWLPQPRLGLSSYLPAWLSKWADDDANMNLRTAIPFVFLGFVAASRLHATRQPGYSWLVTWAGLVIIVVLAEVGQLLLPLRHFDWGDIGWGAVGSAVGLLLAALVSRLIKAFS